MKPVQACPVGHAVPSEPASGSDASLTVGRVKGLVDRFERVAQENAPKTVSTATPRARRSPADDSQAGVSTASVRSSTEARESETAADAVTPASRTEVMDDLASACTFFEASLMLWDSDLFGRVVDRDPRALRQQVDKTVNEFGGRQDYIRITQSDPYVANPVCSVSGPNLFKLMTEGEYPVVPHQLERREPAAFAACIEGLDRNRGNVLLVNDGRIGHVYVVDLPAGGDSGAAFVLQSDLGSGPTPSVSIQDWLGDGARKPIPLADLKQLMSPDFTKQSVAEQKRLLASLSHSSSEQIRASEIKADKPCHFVAATYSPLQFQANLEQVATRAMQCMESADASS